MEGRGTVVARGYLERAEDDGVHDCGKGCQCHERKGVLTASESLDGV